MGAEMRGKGMGVGIRTGSFKWTDERCAELRRQLASIERPSARQIGVGLGISRNAVIGKVERLGLNLPNHGDHNNKRTFRKIAPAKITVRPTMRPEPPMPPQPVDDQAIPQAQRRTLLELGSETCRWPCGNPGDSDFFFCGATPEDGRPYCSAHCARAYSTEYARRPYIPRRNAA